MRVHVRRKSQSRRLANGPTQWSKGGPPSGGNTRPTGPNHRVKGERHGLAHAQKGVKSMAHGLALVANGPRRTRACALARPPAHNCGRVHRRKLSAPAAGGPSRTRAHHTGVGGPCHISTKNTLYSGSSGHGSVGLRGVSGLGSVGWAVWLGHSGLGSVAWAQWLGQCCLGTVPWGQWGWHGPLVGSDGVDTGRVTGGRGMVCGVGRAR